MTEMKPLPHISYIEELLHYDRATGVFRWKPHPTRPASRNTRYAGRVAGFTDRQGYVWISIKKQRYAAHRIAFMIINGHPPVNEVDHIDGNPSNNSADNLRSASHLQNMRNRKPTVSRTLPKGVTFSQARGKYQAYISINSRTRYLGQFTSAIEAHAAYASAARLHYEAFANIDSLKEAA